ncbi:putative peptidoglycan lipid II flippase [Stackebrandtia endophytica]|uniref:Putative peptidoglycan lipid II flippase n=1 Tax=Stackebrandtia endophytica TaxID=1496996 RepID=A0A543AYL1_9ACTN|nr:murein biosynthesis integral membrane protein MurJ [Stackebrandtia endophytica]TQL77663.1 putative peptidoglycan lipid II flippase [Stackebrandtia endophytica]
MTETKASSPSLARHGAIMAAGSLVSRITGFLRNVVMGAALGGLVLGNSYTTAQYFPQMIYEMLMGGILTSVVVPLIVKARNRDADAGVAYTQRLLTLAVTFLALATACIVAAAPLLTRLAAEDNHELVTRLSYFMLPAIFFYGLCALLQAVLNTRDHFAVPMWAPILNNIVIIVVGVVFFVLYTSSADEATRDSIISGNVTTAMVLVLGLGTLAGIVTQSLALWPALRKVGFTWKWRWDFRALGLGEIGRLGAWILLYVGMNQIAMVVLIRLANYAAANGTDGVLTPGPIHYNNAYLIMMMAHGIIAVSIITALMPRLSQAATEGRLGDVAAGLSQGTRLSTLALMPITVCYVVLGTPLAVLLFDWGNFDFASASATGLIIAVAGITLIPFAISQLQTFAFYAMTDTKTVALINIPVVVVRVVGCLLVVAFLPAEHVVAGLMGALGLSFVLTVVLSTYYLRRRVGLLGMREISWTWIRQLIAGAVAGAVAYGAMQMLPDASAGKLTLVGVLAVAGLLIFGVYFVVAYLLKTPEIRDLTSMVRAKLGR